MGCNASTMNGLPNGKAGNMKCQCQCHRNGAPNGTAANGDAGRKESTSSNNMFDNLKEDSRIPLTGKQVFLIKRSWKGISRNIIETGMIMFLSLFEKNEKAITYFKGFEHIETLAELRESKVLEGHVRSVMLTIDEAITHLDEADTVLDMLLHIGKSHTRFAGFDPNVFWLIKEPFLLAVSDTLGDRYTLSMKEIYMKAIDFILSTVSGGFKQKQEEEKKGEIPAITDLGGSEG